MLHLLLGAAATGFAVAWGVERWRHRATLHLAHADLARLVQPGTGRRIAPERAA